jgi:hypothetical protein
MKMTSTKVTLLYIQDKADNKQGKSTINHILTFSSSIQIADQKMERGNLSLKLACIKCLPIHVTR